MLTLRSATPKDIWPDGSGHPPDVEDEIIRIARTEITTEDVQRSGLNFASWFVPYHLAEERVQARLRAEVNQPAEKAEPAPAALPAIATTKHPRADAWSRYPKFSPIKGDAAENSELEAFRKKWHEDSAAKPLPVFRRDQAGSLLLTVSDGRKLFRDLLLQGDETTCLLAFLLSRARKAIARLEERIKELESRKIPAYRGVWEEGQQYEESDLVTLGGSMWFCRHATTGRPTTHHEDWQLCVKAGRDGKPR
jgi:hypothetical protein